MKVLVIQNQVFETIKENIDHLDTLMKAREDIDFIVFPEMFTTPYEHKYFKKNKQASDGPVLDFIKRIANQYQAYVIGGSIPEYDKGNLYNSTYVVDRFGDIISRYRKIHLFSVTYPNGKSFSESDLLSAGKDIVTFNTEFGTMGVMICFDLRFPMLAKRLREKGSLVIFTPAAFNTYTGPMHWHTTFKARAIDNQIFLIGASPSRKSFGDYEPYGHSLVVDPLGKIIGELGEDEDMMVIDIDLNKIKEARASIPIVKNEVNLDKL
jgi:predicted amidohydrolase